MVIGFAALTTVLVINGTIRVGQNTNFLDDIIFTKAETTDGEAKISIDGKGLNFSTKQLVNMGEEFLLNLEVTNKNKNIDGNVTIECGPTNNTEAYNAFITSEITPNIFLLKATSSQEVTLKISLNKVNLSESFDVIYGCRINASAEGSDDYNEEEEIIANNSGVAKPKVDDTNKLVPVTLVNDGTVTKVSQNDPKWYNYAKKQWANAIILIDSPSQTYKEGDVIKEEDIESYFVWIPKYKYRLWNVDTIESTDKYMAHSIDIVFDTTNTSDIEGISCVTPMESGASGNCNNGEYMTHPAFISLDVDGFWVGKFETGYLGATKASEAQVNSNDSSKIIVKPSVYSWRSNTVYNMFVSSYNYERDLDSHMMKNTEWGAVAYLSHSRFGKGSEVNINNNSSYLTGYSALPTTNQSKYPGESGNGDEYNQSYNIEIGYLASTTGNITGIYDMSGAWEYVSAYISGNFGSSGFTTENITSYNSKYFDVYNESSSVTSYNYRILGDATGEMGPFKNYADSDGTKRWHSIWYSDDSSFVESTYPWFGRGGRYHQAVLAGAFHFSRSMGGVNTFGGSRLILS